MKKGIIICGVFVLLVSTSGRIFAKAPIPTPQETPVVGELDAYLLETLYKAKDKDTGLVDIVDDERFKKLVKKHNLALFGGMMIRRFFISSSDQRT